MTELTRKNAWNNGGTFDNPDLLWYAKGVAVMQSRALNDPTSWWFFAAIHGEYITGAGAPPPTAFPNWAHIPGPPNVPTTPLPSSALMDQYWDQCQHAGWFFPPWHRGYLYAIENILREIIKGLGCTYEWALPYWNYFGPNDEYQIPPAFTQQTLPDGTPNPLFVTARYGPLGNGRIYVVIPPVSQACQQNKSYTGVAPSYYGGGETGFEHFGSYTGSLESNPHNYVHTQVGGRRGLMSDPGLAGLDPIFYLHHSNIDRLWAAWNTAGNTNPTDPKWLNGPTASGDREFYMPKPDGTAWHYTPGMVNSISQLNYTYDNLSLGVAPALVSKNAMRLRNLAVQSNDVKQVKDMDTNAKTELVGANNGGLTLNASGGRTTIKIDTTGWSKVTNSLMKASATNLPDEVYLQLEGIKGTADSNMYTVSVNHQYAGHISLFGLRKASQKDDKHGGAGLTIRLDISEIIDQLHINSAIESNSLDVLIQPDGQGQDSEEDVCTIDRISIYRNGQN
jgi:tyrosinase